MQKCKSIFGMLFFLLVYSTVLFGIPVVTSVSPNSGPYTGGTVVTINGTGFTGTTNVSFGNIPAAFVFFSDTKITATSPQSFVGNVNITVTTGSGTSTDSHASLFAYTGSWSALVTNATSGDVTPINLATDAPGTAIAGILAAQQIAITPDGSTAWVTQGPAASLRSIDLATNAVSPSLPVPGHFPVDIAITPDGTLAYVTSPITDSVLVIDIVNSTLVTTISLPLSTPQGIAITPDGTSAYVCCVNSNDVKRIDIASNTVVGLPLPVLGTGPIAIAITPDGATAVVANFSSNSYVVLDLASGDPVNSGVTGAGPYAVAITSNGLFAFITNSLGDSVTVLSGSPFANNTNIPLTVGSIPHGLAISPDSERVYVVETALNQIEIIDVDLLVVVSAPIPVGTSPEWIAITPDQAPIASFTATPVQGTNGVLETFDASNSVSSVGTIVNYEWDFGDGSAVENTSLPVITHTYSTSGNFTVTLTVTNSAGTSTTQTFTGQTVSQNGNEAASELEQVLVVAPIAPSNFAVKLLKNIFLTQIDYIHRLTWTPSSDSSVVSYLIFRNGELIATVPASGPYVYFDHNRHKHEEDTYVLVAVNEQGTQSSVLIATTP